MSSVDTDLIYSDPSNRVSVENVNIVNKCVHLCKIIVMK